MDQYRRMTSGYPKTQEMLVRNYTVRRDRAVALKDRTPLPREHYKRKRKRLRRFLAWALIGLLWQIPAYYFLNGQVRQVIDPTGSSAGLTQSLARTTAFRLSASRLTDPQVSYNDHYVAFQAQTSFQVYDFAQKKVVWQTVPRRYGKILAYQWLPDREALLLFESGVGADPNRPGRVGVGIYSVEIGTGQSASPTGSSNGSYGSAGSSGNPGVSTASTQSGVSERYAASLPLSMQWDRITQISLSTATNLLYFTVEHQGQSRLYEVDVMKHLKVLSWQGEQVAHLAASPDRGTIYYNAKDNRSWQIVAEKAGQRVQIASNPLDKVLGVWNNKLYLGTVQNGYLIKIWTVTDNQPSPQRPDFSLHWQGKVPWDSNSSVSMSGTDLLVSTQSGVYRINSTGSALLAQGSNFFSPSGKYYYTVQAGSSGMVIKRNLA